MKENRAFPFSADRQGANRARAEGRGFCVALTALLTAALTLFAVALWLRPTPLVVDQVDMAQVSDGEYIGFCQNKLLFAVVRVEVSAHQIESIDVLEHKKTYLGYARQIAEAVTEANSLDVDAITGATYTSDTVKMAVFDALTKGISR